MQIPDTVREHAGQVGRLRAVAIRFRRLAVLRVRTLALGVLAASLWLGWTVHLARVQRRAVGAIEVRRGLGLL